MERIGQIIRHPVFEQAYKKNEKWELQREFCRHEISHYLDVARISYIWNLEQYEEAVPHEQASVRLAEIILDECGFTAAEQQQILSAIASHRRRERAGECPLNELIYKADKRSRNCLFCPAEARCSWSEAKKNKDIIV